MKGLVIVHNLPTFDEKAVALTETKTMGAEGDILDN